MKIQISDRPVKLADALRQHIESRLLLTLGRFADRIGTVSVRLAPGVLQTGAPVKFCRIDINLKRKLTVEATHVEAMTAVDHAVDHATRSVARALDQESSGSVPPVIPVRSPKH